MSSSSKNGGELFEVLRRFLEIAWKGSYLRLPPFSELPLELPLSWVLVEACGLAVSTGLTAATGLVFAIEPGFLLVLSFPAMINTP